MKGISKQTLFSTVRSSDRRARRKQQRLRHYPRIWLEWLRSYLKRLKRHRSQTSHQPTTPINTTVRPTTTQSKGSSTQRINSRRQLWARLRQQPLLDDGGLNFTGGPPFRCQPGVTQPASMQWIARPLKLVEPTRSSSPFRYYPRPLSPMLSMVTHGLVSRRWRLPSIHLLGSSSSVKLTAIDGEPSVQQSLKPARKSRVSTWFSYQTAAPDLTIRLMTEIERVSPTPVASHQTVSPPPSAEKTNSSSSTPPTLQFIYRELPCVHIDFAYPSGNFSNHRRLLSEPPIKRRKLGRAPGAFAEITREPELFSQITEPVTVAQTPLLLLLPAKFQPLGSVDRLAGAKYLHNNTDAGFTLPYQSKKCEHTGQLLNKSVGTANNIFEISAQRSLLKPYPRWIRLKRTVNSAKDFSGNQISPITSKHIDAAGGTDILSISHQAVSPPTSPEKTNSLSSKTPLTPQLIYKKLPHAYTDFAYSSSNFSNHCQILSEPPIAIVESVEAADSNDILPISHQTVSPPPSIETTNLSSSKTPLIPQLIYKKLPYVRIDFAHPSSNFSNHRQLSSEPPIATAESVEAADGTDILSISHQAVPPPTSPEKTNSSSSKTPPTLQFSCRAHYCVRIDSAYSSSNFSNHQLLSERPIKRRKILKRTVNSAKDFNDNQISSATSERIEVVGGTDILPMSQEKIQFWTKYYKPVILNLAGDPAARNPAYMEFLQSADPAADINQLLQRVAAFAEVYPEHRARQAQATQLLGGTQPAIAHSLADESHYIFKKG